MLNWLVNKERSKMATKIKKAVKKTFAKRK